MAVIIVQNLEMLPSKSSWLFEFQLGHLANVLGLPFCFPLVALWVYSFFDILCFSYEVMRGGSFRTCLFGVLNVCCIWISIAFPNSRKVSLNDLFENVFCAFRMRFSSLPYAYNPQICHFFSVTNILEFPQAPSY